MIHFKIDSILVWMQANNKFWAHSTGIFLTYFASALCGRLSHITDSIKSDIIGHVRNLPTPPTIFLQTFDNFNRQNVISQRKSKWLIFLKWLQLDSNPESLSSLTNTQPFGKLTFLPNATIWSVWPNGWVFIYELSGSGESSCNHLNFRLRACFEQGVPWHSGNYRARIHSETRTWYDKNIQSLILLT